jgi:hypothetical protein
MFNMSNLIYLDPNFLIKACQNLLLINFGPLTKLLTP